MIITFNSWRTQVFSTHASPHSRSPSSFSSSTVVTFLVHFVSFPLCLSLFVFVLNTHHHKIVLAWSSLQMFRNEEQMQKKHANDGERESCPIFADIYENLFLIPLAVCACVCVQTSILDNKWCKWYALVWLCNDDSNNVTKFVWKKKKLGRIASERIRRWGRGDEGRKIEQQKANRKTWLDKRIQKKRGLSFKLTLSWKQESTSFSLTTDYHHPNAVHLFCASQPVATHTHTHAYLLYKAHTLSTHKTHSHIFHVCFFVVIFW